MSELKAYVCGGWCCEKEAYPKDEVDKVIAEKDAEIAEQDKDIAELKEQVHDYAQGLYVLQARAEKEARHHKYKRCLAMARWCYTMDCMMLETAQKNGTFFKDSWCWKRALWYGKWKRKWLELAEKFKETK